MRLVLKRTFTPYINPSLPTHRHILKHSGNYPTTENVQLLEMGELICGHFRSRQQIVLSPGCSFADIQIQLWPHLLVDKSISSFLIQQVFAECSLRAKDLARMIAQETEKLEDLLGKLHPKSIICPYPVPAHLDCSPSLNPLFNNQPLYPNTIPLMHF